METHSARAVNAFAASLRPLLQSLDQTFEGLITEGFPGGIYRIAPLDNGIPNDNKPIRLTIDGLVRAYLFVSYRCEVAGERNELQIVSSSFKFSPLTDEPLIRLEYVREMKNAHVPVSHYQIHGHRDAWTYLSSSPSSSPAASRHSKQRSRMSRTPRMSEVHVPTGGHLFRPCLEDFVAFLIYEFGVEHSPEALELIAAGREAWRRRQAHAVVHAHTDDVIGELESLGFRVQRSS